MNDEQEEQKEQADYNYDIDGQHLFSSNYNDLEIWQNYSLRKIS